MTQVGALGGQYTCELKLAAHLKKWLPTHVVAAARRYAAMTEVAFYDQGQLEADMAAYAFPFRPRGISVSSNFEDWPIDALPHVQILSPAWEQAGGDQRGLHFKYQTQVVCMVGAQDQADTRFIRACYEDAIVDAVMQHQSLGGYAAGVDMVGGGPAQFDELSGDMARTLEGSIAVFEVLVEGQLDPKSGPAEPLPDDDNDVPPVNPADPVAETLTVEYPDGKVTETTADDYPED